MKEFREIEGQYHAETSSGQSQKFCSWELQFIVYTVHACSPTLFSFKNLPDLIIIYNVKFY